MPSYHSHYKYSNGFHSAIVNFIFTLSIRSPMPFRTFIFCLLIILSVTSCKKSGNQPEGKKPIDLYIAADFNTIAYGAAGYLKNGDQVIVGGPSSRATDIVVKGNDVYLAGSSNSRATVWKNGDIFYMDAFASTVISAIAIKDNDVYFAGTYGDRATIWKNGSPALLRTGNSTATAIFVQGNDLYVAGTVDLSNGRRVACYWKNGNEFLLVSDSYNTVVNGLFVVGNDVYVTGLNSGYWPVYWKNEKIFNLQEDVPANYTREYTMGGIAVSGADVYVVGSVVYKGNDPWKDTYIPRTVQYWKNGSLIKTNGLIGSAIDLTFYNGFPYILQDRSYVIDGRQIPISENVSAKAFFIAGN